MALLHPMTDGEYEALLTDAIKDYAQDRVRNGQWSPTEALEESAKGFTRLLPQGTQTPDHYLFMVVDDDSHQPVGMLWYMVRRGP
jgi:hypothetical protein